MDKGIRFIKRELTAALKRNLPEVEVKASAKRMDSIPIRFPEQSSAAFNYKIEVSKKIDSHIVYYPLLYNVNQDNDQHSSMSALGKFVLEDKDMTDGIPAAILFFIAQKDFQFRDSDGEVVKVLAGEIVIGDQTAATLDEVLRYYKQEG